ncbi:MAG TPA: SpoIIE family protein phosphatase [Geobacteraceae bacterium]|nr:SpoIIE family protein phosphatase [Geobacteraceae bacterium]
MKESSDAVRSWEAEREKIIGLGERSLRKTYYPELQQKLDELERFRALLDQSNDCIFLFHVLSNRFIDVNESACRQLGCSRRELLAVSWDQLFPEEAVARSMESLATGLEQGWDRDTITTIMRKHSGEELPVEITIRVVTFNKELYGVAVARDITERKRAERAHMENSRMLREMELARQIQLSLLPVAPPEIPGVTLAGFCLPATHVGGDYYYFAKRDNGIVDLAVADVSGHNIGAALMTAEARSVLRTQLATGSSAGRILTAMNEILHEDLDRAELFITVFCASFDTSSRTLTYANAGHAPPLLFRHSAPACQWLDADGLIMGVRGNVDFEEKQIRLQSGDVLILYTDGVTEADNGRGELFGIERLCNILHARHRESPQAIIDAIILNVAAFSGTIPMEDDVTMVVMKVE